MTVTGPVALTPAMRALSTADDRHSRSAAIVLCDPHFAHREVIRRNIFTTSIRWECILAGPWASGERALLRAAANLWHGYGEVDLAALTTLSNLHYALLRRMLDASRGSGARAA